MIRLADPAAEHRALSTAIDAAVARVLASGRYILGPEVEALEGEVAAAVGAEHGVGVASGTDALALSLLALGVGPGDEVVVPAFTFFATVEAVLRIGAVPVFADVDPVTSCIATEALETTPRTRALIAVHLYGHPADLPALRAFCTERRIALVEDVAQAFGASINGMAAGSAGDAAALSFFPSKNLGGAGDGGMVLTSDPEVAERVRLLRAHGTREKHRPVIAGFNSRLDEVQAAILRVKLPHVEPWNGRRRELAARYDGALAGAPVALPAVGDGVRHAFHLYTIRSETREELRESLGAVGIESAVHYPVPMPLTEACAHLGAAPGDFPVAEALSREVLSLPMHPHLSDADVDAVAAEILRG